MATLDNNELITLGAVAIVSNKFFNINSRTISRIDPMI